MDNQRLDKIDSHIKEVKGLLEELEHTAQSVKERRQHEAVDHLEEYIDASQVDLSEISLFKEEALNEIKGLLNKLKGLVRPPQ
jgi:hypothetical protein